MLRLETELAYSRQGNLASFGHDVMQSFPHLGIPGSGTRSSGAQRVMS